MLTNTPKRSSYKEEGLFGVKLQIFESVLVTKALNLPPHMMTGAISEPNHSPHGCKGKDKKKESGRLQGSSLGTYPWWPNFLLLSHCPSNGTTSQSMLQVGNRGFSNELFWGTLIQPCPWSQSKVLWWCRKPPCLLCLALDLELWLPDSCLVLAFANNS